MLQSSDGIIETIAKDMAESFMDKKMTEDMSISQFIKRFHQDDMLFIVKLASRISQSNLCQAMWQ